MKYLIRHSRGMSRDFPDHIQELTSFYQLDFVANLETGCSGTKVTSMVISTL